MERNISSESFSPGYCEYLVDGNADKRIVLIRASAVIAGVVLLSFLFSLLSFIPQVFAVWLVLIAALEVAVFRMTRREFEYTIAMGEMTVEEIFGKRWRRKLVTLRIADADRVFHVKDFNDEQITRLCANKMIFASPKKSEFMYCLCMKDDGGKNSKTAVVFSGCKKMLDAIKFYNRSAIV